MRIYPSHLKPVPLEPQIEDFEVIDVDPQRGQGVRVLRPFHRGEILFRMNGVITNEITQSTLQIGPDTHLDDPYFAGKVLHSCDPNSWFDTSSWLFIAERNIAAGSLLTMDYEQTEDVLFRSFMCCCGAIVCRGEIVGRKALAPLATPPAA